jgi:hypothetical protein
MLESELPHKHSEFQRPPEHPSQVVTAVEPDFLYNSPTEDSGKDKDIEAVRQHIETVDISNSDLAILDRKLRTAKTAYAKLYRELYPEKIKTYMDDSDIARLPPPSKIVTFFSKQQQGLRNLHATMEAVRFQSDKLNDIYDERFEKAREEIYNDLSCRATLGYIENQIREGDKYVEVVEGNLRGESYFEVLSLNINDNKVVIRCGKDLGGDREVPISYLLNEKRYSEELIKKCPWLED